MRKANKHSFTAVVFFELVDPFIDELDPSQIVGELIKIKTGEYENMLYGAVEFISPIAVEQVETDEFDDLPTEDEVLGPE